MNFDIRKTALIPYFSTGSTQLYHIVEQLLQQSGKADLFISSFTISEEFIRKLQKLTDQNKITQLNLLIDSRSAKKTLHLSWFLSSVANEVYLANNHSKIILISNEQFKISVVTSQNQTRGNRYEAGMISVSPDIYNYYKTKLDIELKNCLKLSDVLGRNTRKS
ncbi:MAG: hypothetical protein QM503_10695 [Bacteroidota bacterium]